jgi:inhibitor of cysteine peptidase
LDITTNQAGFKSDIMKRKTKQSGLACAGVIIIICFIYAINVQPAVFGNVFDFLFRNSFDSTTCSDLMTFSSYDELIEYLRNNNKGYGYYGHGWEDSGQIRLFSSNSASKSVSIPGISPADNEDFGTLVDYSKTNIQVEGVNEPDVIKTDGRYIYLIANSKIYIIKAYPAEEAELLSEISLGNDFSVSDLFINGDKLIILGTSNRDIPAPEPLKEDYMYYWWPTVTTTVINIYDVSDKDAPGVSKEVEIDGYYFDSRMIGDYVYIITTEDTGLIYREYDGNETISLPQVTINDVTKTLPPDHVHYVNTTEPIETMTHVVAIDLKNKDISQESYMISSSQNMYVSKNNIYLTCTEYEYQESNILAGRLYTSSIENTIIHKIQIKNGEIIYKNKGEVPGRILNQFSMDEHNGYFRIATTIGNVWDREVKSSNNVYILDSDLERVSEIENIAPGERIYSARFMGGKAYLVTFKKVDPFFTLDLSNPENPKVLGKLKIPGYSDYLHPFDENHIIGIGKDTVEALDELKESRGIDFAWYQGIKIALFDVSDFENPKEVSKIVIGDRGTSSPALYDHKAFLFDRDKELLVIPVSVCEIPDEVKEENDGYTGNIYGDFTFQGAYVYKLTLDGFEYRGRLTHLDQQDTIKTGYWGYYGDKEIHRSLYIGDVLYTISDKMIKMNDLGDLSELNSIELA